MGRVLGDFLRALRRSHGIGQGPPAQAIGIDRSGFSRVEAGKAHLDVRKLTQVLAAIVPGGAQAVLGHDDARRALLRAMASDENDGVRILGMALQVRGADADKLTRFWFRAVRSPEKGADSAGVVGYATPEGTETP